MATPMPCESCRSCLPIVFYCQYGLTYSTCAITFARRSLSRISATPAYSDVAHLSHLRQFALLSIRASPFSPDPKQITFVALR